MATPTRIEITWIDGRTETVTPALVDGIAFESHLRANPHLGELRTNPIRAAAYRAWHALHRRAKREPGVVCPEWDDFMNEVADIELVTEGADDAELVDLTADGAIQGKDTPAAASAS